jgi:ribose transport system permease protein
MAEAPARIEQSKRGLSGTSGSLRQRVDPAIASAFGCIVLVLLVGSIYSSSFLSPEYLLQQLKVASFLGVIATGTMIVILLGQIDLSVPWVVAVGGMMATAATGWGWGPLGEAIAIPFGIACGVALGLVNGVGVALLRIPSMVVTLAVNAVAQGLMVVHTGGFSPQQSSSPAMRLLATGNSLLGIPNALVVWAVLGAAAVFLLTRTTFGRAVYAIGNRERAAYLSGARTRAVVIGAFALAGGLSAFGGVLLAGYASKAAQAMGDAYLLPAIAAVVLGGTSILGGRGNYLGTVAGVILITLLQSMLSVMQMEEFGRHVVYGIVIIAMLLLYGRGKRMSE